MDSRELRWALMRIALRHDGLRRVFEAAADSKLGQREPEGFADFMARAGAPRTVWISGTALTECRENCADDLPWLRAGFGESGEADRLDEGLRQCGLNPEPMLEAPFLRVLSVFAGSPEGATLRRHIRFDPSFLSFSEVCAFYNLLKTAEDRQIGQSGEDNVMPPALADDLLKGAIAASEFLGGVLTPSQVYRMSAAGELPCIKKGRVLYFRKSELEAAFTSGMGSDG